MRGDCRRDNRSALDLAEAAAEVYRTDPSFAAPPAVWEALVDAMPTLLSEQ